MKILGVDPGTGRMGWAILEKVASREKLLAYDCIETPAHMPLASRLENIYKVMSAVIREHRPDQAAVEELFFVKNIKTGMSVGHARGVILLVAQLAGLPIFEYKPTVIKQAVTGYGNADKKQVQQMVKAILKLPELIKPDDAADAVAVALTHSAIGRVA